MVTGSKIDVSYWACPPTPKHTACTDELLPETHSGGEPEIEGYCPTKVYPATGDNRSVLQSGGTVSGLRKDRGAGGGNGRSIGGLSS
jgi:hypothetical protein